METTATLPSPKTPAQEQSHGKRGHARLLLLPALLLLCILNWISVWPILRNPAFRGAQDFSIFYTGSRVILNGASRQLYDLSVQAQYQTAVYRSHPLPFLHLAYELMLFLPLGLLSFNAAYRIWVSLSVAMALAAAFMLSRRMQYFPRPAPLWACAAAIASFPLIWTLCQGQDSILLLLIFVLVYVKLKSDQEGMAGLMLAAGLFKFTIVAPFALVFLLRRRWKFVAGFAGGGALVLLVCVWITGIRGAVQYVQLLYLLAARPSLGYIYPLLMPDVRGFALTVLAGSGLQRIEFEIITVTVSIVLLALPFVTFFPDKRSERFDPWFALNVATAILVSPDLYWHDLSVLLVAVLLVANMLAKRGRQTWGMWVAATFWALTFASAWPVYLLPHNVYTSYFFLPLALMAVWLAIRARAVTHETAPEAILTSLRPAS